MDDWLCMALLSPRVLCDNNAFASQDAADSASGVSSATDYTGMDRYLPYSQDETTPYTRHKM
jgi:hypothetical protein